MSSSNTLSGTDLWQKILNRLEERLQYGALEQAKAVVDVALDGNELLLTVNTEEAEAHFEAEINQQRIIILARPEITLESIRVVITDAE